MHDLMTTAFYLAACINLQLDPVFSFTKMIYQDDYPTRRRNRIDFVAGDFLCLFWENMELGLEKETEDVAGDHKANW